MQFRILKGKRLNEGADYVFWQTEQECQNIIIIYIGRYSMPTITTQNIVEGPIRVCKVSDKIYIILNFSTITRALQLNEQTGYFYVITTMNFKTDMFSMC